MRLCLVSFFSPLPLEPSIWSEEGNVMHLPVVALPVLSCISVYRSSYTPNNISNFKSVIRDHLCFTFFSEYELDMCPFAIMKCPLFWKITHLSTRSTY